MSKNLANEDLSSVSDETLQKIKIVKKSKNGNVDNKRKVSKQSKKTRRNARRKNNKPTQTGKVKAISFSKEHNTNIEKFYEGQTVFTKRGVGIVEGRAWSKDKVGMIYVRHRNTGKNKRTAYLPKDLMKLVIEDIHGNNIPVSPMFYDHLIVTVGKPVTFYENNRKVAILTKRQQASLERDKIASLKGAFNLIKTLEGKDLLW